MNLTKYFISVCTVQYCMYVVSILVRMIRAPSTKRTLLPLCFMIKKNNLEKSENKYYSVKFVVTFCIVAVKRKL